MEDQKDHPVQLNQERMPNYIRLLFVVNSIALPFLRRIFCSKWKSVTGTDWENTQEDALKFINSNGKSIYRDARPIQKKVLDSGNIDEWDLLLVVQSIKSLDIKHEEDFSLLNNTYISKSKCNKCFETLKEIRNKLAHSGSIEMDNEKFQEMWKTLSDVLITLGVSPKELDDAKVKSILEDKNIKKDRYINEANTEKAQQLKSRGNEMYKKTNYSKAIELYTEAIQLTGIPSEDLAVLYSNRSIAFLKINDLECAKDDAKGAVHLRPTWWKGYFRLGNAYKAMENYEKALKNFFLALGWEPPLSEVAEIKEECYHCRHIISKLARKEHLDPMYYASIDNVTNKGVKNSPQFLKLLRKATSKLETENYILLRLCGEGHNYRWGRGVEQDYEIAARYYAKAAAKGNAEGLYNLGQLTVEGLGVQRNISEAIRLFEQAASQDISIERMGKKYPNIGVVEAEHTLGLQYETGVGVPQDYGKALYWYTRAVKHGVDTSANNIAIMYQKGSGVPQNFQTAIHYFKLAASRKLVRAMENLAIQYLGMCDVKNARDWYAFGIANESIALKTRENEFQMLFQMFGETPINESFNENVFALELLDEVKNGPLKHLICDDLPTYGERIDIVKKFSEMQLKDCPEMTTTRETKGLTDPYRTFIRKTHREVVKIMKKGKSNETWRANPAKLQPKTPSDLIGLKPIYFQDMDSSKDHVYEGFVIKLTLIEDAVLGRPSIAQIAEDDKGDAQRIFIYNFAQNKETQDSLGFGCKISIVNPYFRITQDGKPAIRVDDTSLMFLHPNLTDKNRCRYCEKDRGTVPCRKCRRSFYCSKQCLLQDSSLLSHELVCFKRL